MCVTRAVTRDRGLFSETARLRLNTQFASNSGGAGWWGRKAGAKPACLTIMLQVQHACPDFKRLSHELPLP
jgi:hypothetical protein